MCAHPQVTKPIYTCQLEQSQGNIFVPHNNVKYKDYLETMFV